MNSDFFKNMLELYGNPLFREGFAEYFHRAQQEGLEAARKFWGTDRKKDMFTGNMTELFEQMMEFYSVLGFVSKQKYDNLAKENEELKKENELLKNALRDLDTKIYTEGTKQVQELWQETVQKQMEMGTEVAKSFFDLFRPRDRE